MRSYLFLRGDGFYPLELNDDDEACRNAELNPGTVRVENAITQEVVWPVSATKSPPIAPLVLELQRLATTDYPLCPEARLLLEMAVDAQLGKPIDVAKLARGV